MLDWVRQALKRGWPLLLVLLLLGGYWLLPVSGQVIVIPGQAGASGRTSLIWPHIEVVSASSSQKNIIRVTDVVPWAHVLLTANGQPANLERYWGNPGGTWTWEWSFTMPQAGTPPKSRGTTIAFYRDCDGGCRERGIAILGNGPTTPQPAAPPTKLGVVFANPERQWHGRSGWDVELTYAQPADQERWGIDQLAAQVHRATANGQRVLVRVDYGRGQSLPPAGDHLALAKYLRYLKRLARDDRLREVYGYVIGSGFNTSDSNSMSPDHPVTPTWYARLFNGYGEAASRTDNVVQIIRAENPRVRVLVGPVRPWVTDQRGERPWTIDAPWLNYMNSLVAALNEGVLAKQAAGVALAAPDGFALQVPGRPGAPELVGRDGSEEPRLDVRRAAWGGAQAGFRIYQDWLAIINAYPTTRGLLAYITSTNTFAPDEGTPPAQNYPRGWLTTALQVVNEEPQVQALCWFIDGPLGDTQWDWFSLSRPVGRLIDAAQEFDALLRDGS